jgi:uncharacterized OsmC-like protein
MLRWQMKCTFAASVPAGTKNSKGENMQETLATITNGVEVTRIHETIAAVRANPQAGKFNFRVQNRWLNGGENLSEVRPFYAGGKLTKHKTKFVLSADEPEILLGTDNGANPVEHLLHALAACVTTSMVYHASARGIAIEQVESTLEGDLDLRGFLGIAPQIRNGYQNIRLTMRIKASNLTDEELRDLTALGPRFSPVYDSITRGVPVEFAAERIE